MKLSKTSFVLLFCFALVNTCYAQNKVALVDAKSFYASENGITRLVDALKLVNPKFPALTAEEKENEFNRTEKKCPDAKDEKIKSATIALDAKEKVVCDAIKDIAESVQTFKIKQGFFIILDIHSCNAVTHLCDEAVDVTKQFVDEYNGAKK